MPPVVNMSKKAVEKDVIDSIIRRHVAAVEHLQLVAQIAAAAVTTTDSQDDAILPFH